MPIVIGLDSDVEWSNPLNLSSGIKSDFGLDGTSSAETKSAPAASSRDWDDIVDTVIAEAAGEGEDGMAAVASVIKNRAGIRGKTAAEVVREPDQFTGYGKPGDAAKKAMQDPEMRRRAEAVISSVFSGERPDATGGADHYHATSVAPNWATKMPRTTQVGNHLFYNSKGDRAQPKAETTALGLSAEMPRSDASSAFDAILTKQPESSARVPNPEGKGLARLVRPAADAPDGTGGALSFVHKGQDKISPAFSAILVDASKSMGRNFTITSGYRAPSHPVEARKKNPGQHSHGTAADISMRGMDDAQRAQLVTELRARGVRRFGTYTNEPDMLHVDMKDQGGTGATWFMHDTTNKRLAKAPEWFQELSRQPAGSAARAAPAAGDSEASGGIVIDENFTSDNPGMMAQANQLREARAQQEAEVQAAAEAQRIATKTGAENEAVAARERELDADRADRYQVIDESELPEWQKKWDEENRSTGVLGDTGRILKSGVIGLGQSATSLADTVFRRLPGGEKFLEASDAIDRWALGETFDNKLDTAQDRARSTVTPEQQAADAKNWWDTEKGWFGPAWRDPRSYLRGVGESAPGTVVTMLPGGILARGKYLSMIAAGAEQKVAAATAAKVATVAGAVSEGLVGGADSTRNVRERIAQIPREQLAQSETVRLLVEGGMSEGDAIRALTEDAATQAFVISGVATGMFGGFGDRALARIIADGVGGGVVRRVLAGAARGSVAEGVFEELPQGVAQQISDNAAIQRIDPSQSLTEGWEEAAAAGVATGGAMGAGMGGAGGAASRRQGTSAPAHGTPQPATEQDAEPQQRKGPLARAVSHGEEESRRRMDEQHAAERQQLEAMLGGKTANAHVDEMLAGAAADIERERAGVPEVGATVRVDAEGMEPILGRVESYEGDEALVFDSGTGEVYQVPIGSLTKTADSIDRQAASLRAKQAEPPALDALPEESSDEALKPLEPRAAETTTEIPPAAEQKPATEKRPTRPQPGGRVIVEGPDGARFPARIESYQDDGAEAVVIDDQGKPFQVPVENLSVSALTPAQVEQQELERNPPIEREPADAGPNSRRVGDNTVVLPDEKHAHLYDLAREQVIAKKLGGTSQVDMSKVLPAERKRLADEFGVSVDDLASMADDYRYRVERAAKEAKSKLPVQMHQVNERLLKQRQTAATKGSPEAVAARDEAGQWWDVELTHIGRRQVLEKAGVKRPDKVMWQHLTPGIQKKLLAVREAESGDASPKGADIGPSAVPGQRTDNAAHEAATSPTNDLPEPSQAQKEAGNYKLGRIRLGGLDISIENPAGSDRKGTSASGKAWSVKMKSHYGYIRGTVGRDKDHIDIFVKPGTEALDDAAPIFVVDQRDPARGRFDEHKVMAGYGSEEEARAAYLENYTSGWKGLGAISPATLGEFKAWLGSGKTAEPFAPKWFGSRDKAEAHVAKEKLAGTHEVVESGKRFEIREKSAKPATKIHKQSSQQQQDQGTDEPVYGKSYEELYPTDEHAIDAAIKEVTRLHRGPKPIEEAIRKGASNKDLLEVAKKLYGISGSSGPAYMVDTAETPAVRVNLYKKDGVERVTLRGQRLTDKLRELFSPEATTAATPANEKTVAREEDAVEPRALLRSKAWKSAWADSQFGQPHPDSPVAYQMAKGWNDAKAGNEPQRRPADGTKYRRDGHNPIDDYLMGYVAAREGKGVEIRATEAEAVFGRYLADTVETPAAWEVEAGAARKASSRRDYSNTIQSLRQGLESWADQGGNSLLESKLELAERLQGLSDADYAKVAPFIHRDMEPGVTLEPEKGMAAIDEALKGSAPKPAKRPAASKPKLPVTPNTVFTEDAAEKARALLRQKLPANNAAGGTSGNKRFSIAPDRLAAWQKHVGLLMSGSAKLESFVVLNEAPVLAAAIGGSTKGRIVLNTRKFYAIRSKHRDIPMEVWTQLPELLANPRFVFGRRDGSNTVALMAQLEDGSNIVVGLKDGDISTITPWDNDKGESEARLADELRRALSERGTVYAETREALDEILKLTRSNSGAQPPSRGGLSHQGHKAKIITKAHVVKDAPRSSHDASAYGQSPDELRTELESGPVGYLIPRLIEGGILHIGTASDMAPGIGETGWTTTGGTIHLVADRIRRGAGTAILLHEGFHVGRQSLFAQTVWPALEKRLAGLYRQFERSSGKARTYFDAARDHVAAVEAGRGPYGDALAVEEFGAYAVQHYEQAPQTLRRWIDDLIGAIKAWLLQRFGRQFGQVSPAQLRALAISALRSSTSKSQGDIESERRFSIDAEILQAGITLAGYHIEGGARTFSAYSRAMLADLGEDVRPYLKSWYMGVKYDPRAARFEGMSSAAEVEGTEVADIAVDEESASDEPAELDQSGSRALEAAPADQISRAETGRASRTGAERSSRADVSGSEPARGERVSSRRGVADGQGDLLAAAARTDDNAEPRRDRQQSDGGNQERGENRRDQVKPKAETISKTLRDVKSAAVPAQQRPADYIITADDNLGEGGQKAKFRGNMAAIRLLRTLEDEKRPATRDEQSALAKWVGWGGLRNAFYREDGTVAKGWEKEAKELKELLDSAEYASAESSTRNAHYTSAEIVNAAWHIARRLGFKGGQVLEPAVGAGNFLGLMPGELRDGARITGVELDRVTGGMAKHLYPGANIQTPIGFEKLTVPDNYFDLVIGNPPFGSEKLYDKQRRHLNKLSIHNFFFAKSIETLRPGGVLAMVVTNRFLDGTSEAAREHIAKSADLVGAIRLPNNAFLKNAGTEVTTDIVVLRKRLEGDKPDTSWTKVGEWKGKDGKAVPLNQYFIANPDMMLGDFGAYGTMYGSDDPALVARDGDDLPALLANAVRSLPQNIIIEPGAATVTETVTLAEGVNDLQVGAMFAGDDGSVHIRMPDHLGQTVSQAIAFPNDTAKERVSGMVRVRDAFAKLRRAQIDEKATDGQIENLRKRLNTLYDGFVKKHGPINADANKRLFRDDPTWPQISALEQNFDKGISSTVAQRTGEKAKPASAEKTAIFTKRTQQPYRRPTSASSAKDALATVLNDFGRVNLDAMSELYGKPAAVIVEELGPLLYKTPAGNYETADHYLSGNVKKKLAEAERAAEADPDFRRNVAALRDVQPADIEAVDIDVKAGAPWIPAKHVEDFIKRVAETGVRPRAFYSRGNAKWDIDVPSPSAPASTLWGTDRAGVGTILSAALNGQSITISDRMSDGKTVVDQAATDAANEKVERVKAEWRKWLWDNDARRDELVRIYNDTFNTDVLRSYDGAHLSLPGKVGDDIIEMRPHQKSFIWRTMQSGTALADHTVGAGKTFAAIASAMEKRRIGQARKPMFVVPNHLVGQWGADFVKLYPGAKVLATTEKDFEKDNRKRLFARIATGDWDAVVVAHSSFGRIGIDPEYEARFIQSQMDDLEASITELRRETGEKSRNVSQLTKWRDNLKAKMERLLDAGTKDDGLTFDELGVDALYVDEAHEFKNLAYSTSMQRVAGLGNTAGSQKAADLFMKSRFILERTNGNNVVFLTGTPLSNTMAEMFTVQRYLSEGTLRDLGVSHFDAWAKVFGEVVSDWELSPSGQYKLNSRFAKFVNVPELMQHYLSFADVITNDDIKAQLAAIGKKLPLPKVRGGKPMNITVERSSDQATYIGEGTPDDNGNLVFPRGSIVWRAENLPKKQEKGADNMLKVMSDARKAALDMRLVDAGYGDFRGSKVHRAADEMARIHKKWEKKRGIQLVFIDLSTPKKAKAAEEARLRELIQKAEDGDEKAQETLDNMSPDEFLALQSPFSVYDDLRQKLIDRGVSPNEIAFIHDANTQAQKEELFGKVRSGRVRFLFGSTPKMGAGTNVQNRLVALHHIDAPWRPSDLEQRDGRGIRQGNELYGEDPEGFEIEILRYATKNTLDARTWQTIEAKARFIQQVRKGNLKTREIEDIAGEAANAAEMKAAASGNPLILEEMETRRRLRQLEGQSVEHDREQHRIRSNIRSLNDEADSLRKRQPAVEADASRAAAAEKTAFAGTVNGETFDKPKEFGAAIIAAIRHELIEKEGVSDIGEYAGFKIAIEHLHSREFNISLSGERDYHVPVEDAADMDPTGTAMRITNTVRRLANVPATDKERLSGIEKQLPALETQLGPWAGSKELEETATRHRRLVEALRPKPKGAVPTIEVTVDANVAPEPPRQHKRTDPAVASDGRLVSAGKPSLRSDIALRDAAIERVTEDGLRTGHEYLLAIDDDGSIIEYGTAGQPSNTGMNNRLLGAMANPDRKVVVFHNHPRNGPLSTPDIAYLAYPGLHSIWAAGHSGQITRASLTEGASAALSRSTPDLAALSVSKVANAMLGVENHLASFLQSRVNSRAIVTEEAQVAHDVAKLMAAERGGLIDFTTNNPYDTSAIPGLDAVIDAAAQKLAGELFNGREAEGQRDDRPAQSLRHIAELAAAPVASKQNAGRRSAATGPAETSAPDYQRETGSREIGRRVTETRIIQDLRGKLTDLQPALLKTVPLNYFSELARSNMTAVGEYMRVKRLMDAFRGKKHADADAIAQDWLKYTRLGYMGKDTAKAQELAELMHDTTLAGVDPSKTDKETKGKPGYEALRKRYLAMAPNGRDLYQRVRDAYAEQQAELDQILLDNVRKAQEIAQRQAEDRYKRTLQRIKDAGLKGIDRRNAEEDAASAYKTETTKARWAAKARLTKMRIAFENSRVEEPYFPLGRFGRYFATVRDIDGRVLSFSKFERAADRDRAVRDLRREYPNAKIEAGVMEQGSDLRRAMDPRIVAEIEEILGGAGVGADIMDQIWQRYLESMPDLSTRKRFIHRKGTGGFSADALRVFSSHMFHAAHQMARMKYGLELQELVDQTFDQAKEADDATRAVTLANELSNRHEWVMNPTGGKVAQTMTSVAFVWFLAGSVSAAMVNMTQTFMLGLPILGARFGGIAKAGAALGRASSDSVRGKGSVVNGNLSADERAAMEAFYESGLIDRTQSHDLAGVGETGVEYTPLRAKVMGVISWMFHRAEVWNREVTALAAYRMARDAGQNTSEAIDTAHDLTWKTHFDYSNSSRPALMQNDFAKVALVFRQHNINMLYRVFRDIHQAFKGDTPNARREARYQLAGITGMMALMAGVTGTIGFNLLMGIASMVFGDDDDPMDFEQNFRANVVDILGPELGGMVLNGVPGHYLGVDLSSRIGMPDLWFRSPTRELQGKAEYQYWLSQTLGATAGLGEQLYTGFRVMTDEGDVARGLEMMAPKPIRDLFKAYRYTDEGVTTIGGDEVLPKDQVSVHDIVAQALGFTPARVAETYERNSALKNAERRVREARQRLINRWAMAALAKDKDAAGEAIEAIKRFNAAKVNAGVAITKETLQRSIRTRSKNSAKREDGVLIQNEALGKELRDRLADSIYR